MSRHTRPMPAQDEDRFCPTCGEQPARIGGDFHPTPANTGLDPDDPPMMLYTALCRQGHEWVVNVNWE